MLPGRTETVFGASVLLAAGSAINGINSAPVTTSPPSLLHWTGCSLLRPRISTVITSTLFCFTFPLTLSPSGYVGFMWLGICVTY